ncbi:T9SS type A sorting domain-containing protein [Ekhidna sp.]|uniref:T9SS type A sorting domain-containing protein n=2 Tax=Ekhidna sp. TaxID=2608089 RepID=UPI003CCC2398
MPGMVRALIILFFISVVGELFAQPANDAFANAIEVSGLINNCSADAAYTTIGASGDLNAGSCWNNGGPQLNVWFSFVATTSSISLTVDRGGSKGTQQRTQVALWEADGTTEINCKRYQYNTEDVVVEASGTLTPGNTYYISVDSYNTGYDGTFSLCLSDVVSNDFYAGAINVTSLINGCSGDAAYTTIGASGDLNAGSCWNNGGPQLNKWFYFVATANSISVTVDRGGSKGTQQRTQVAIWEADGTTEVACKRYQYNTEDVVVEASGTLTPGNTYYISVDSYNTGYDGTFSLCLSDAVSNDYYEGAINITSLINGCSADAAYTTIGASGDLNAGSCWNNGGPQLNKWFYFVASASSISVTVDRGGSKGTQQRTQVAIWEVDGTTEVACKRYQFNTEDVVVEASGTLTPGNTYYISVDSYNTGYDGTFSLCLSDAVSNDFYEGAIDVTGLINDCSADAAYTTIGASGDLNAGSCWNNGGPQLNKWFSFVASSSSISVTVDRGGSKGTQQRTQVAIWEADGTTEVACKRYQFNTEDVVVEASGTLTPGNTYYISVDSYNTGYDGTFSLCLSDEVSYDYYEGAIEIADINNWCSSDAAYTTIGGSADRNAGSCWNNGGPQLNKWFYFVAVTDGISVTVDRGGSKGTQQRTQLAIWEADGTTEVACKRYQFNTEDVIVEAAESLTPGNTYYISVDSYNTGYDGTFTLCVNDNPSYDFYSGAYEITDLNNWCSADAEFTTIGGSPDLNAGSCWNNGGPQLNKWFTFTALSSTVDITVDRGGSQGTQQRTQLALWEADGTTEIDCNRYASNTDDVSISYTGLTAGNDYYISVDSYSTGYDGTFTLCVSNIDETYYSIGDGAWNDPANWSFSGHGGGSAGDYPQAGDVAYIEGNSITVSSNQEAAQVNINVATAATSLTIDGATLDVNGQFNFTNTGNNFNGNVSIINGGTLDVLDDLTLTRSGGVNTFDLSASGTSVMSVNQDFIVNSTGGSTVNNTININNTSSLTVSGQTTLSTLSGVKTILALNDASSFTPAEDINLVADGVDLVEIEINNDATLNVGSTILRGTPAYGILDCNDNALVAFNSTNNLQIWPATAGESTDGFNYVNVLIDNSRITYPQITLEGDVSVSGTLTLTDGIVQGSSSAVLTLPNGASLSGGGADSFIDGPLENIGNESFQFPVGDGNIWAPIEVTGLVGGDATTSFTAEYVHASLGNLNIEIPDDSGEDLDHVSSIEYWNLDVSGSLTSANVTLHWKDASRSEIANYADLRVAHFDSGDSEWENYGVDAISSMDPGSIRVDNVTTFSPFSFGSISTSNPLPVELAFFDGRNEGNEIVLDWATYSEINNDHFVIEESFDGETFEQIALIAGMGNSNMLNEYSFRKQKIYRGDLFYRLSQVDFDGATEMLGVVHITDSEALEKPMFYPNPLEGSELTIQLFGLYPSVVVRINDLAGSLAHETHLDQPSGEITLQTQLNPGVYAVTIITPGAKTIHRLLVK